METEWTFRFYLMQSGSGACDSSVIQAASLEHEAFMSLAKVAPCPGPKEVCG